MSGILRNPLFSLVKPSMPFPGASKVLWSVSLPSHPCLSSTDRRSPWSSLKTFLCFCIGASSCQCRPPFKLATRAFPWQMPPASSNRTNCSLTLVSRSPLSESPWTAYCLSGTMLTHRAFPGSLLGLFLWTLDLVFSSLLTDPVSLKSEPSLCLLQENRPSFPSDYHCEVLVLTYRPFALTPLFGFFEASPPCSLVFFNLEDLSSQGLAFLSSDLVPST